MNTNPPAFPSHGSMGEVAQEGMSLRDYFAAAVIRGLMANQQIDLGNISSKNERHLKDMARTVWRIAEAMLDARAELSEAEQIEEAKRRG